jgi:hypothetical protein
MTSPNHRRFTMKPITTRKRFYAPATIAFVNRARLSQT